MGEIATYQTPRKISNRVQSSLLTHPVVPLHFRYTLSRYQYDGHSEGLSLHDGLLKPIRKMNHLDLVLYERAVELFEARYQDMVHQEAGNKEPLCHSLGGKSGGDMLPTRLSFGSCLSNECQNKICRDCDRSYFW